MVIRREVNSAILEANTHNDDYINCLPDYFHNNKLDYVENLY